MRKSPYAVVFDVGRVLVDFNHQSLLDFLEQHGAEVRTPREFVERTDLFRYECGRLSTEESTLQQPAIGAGTPFTTGVPPPCGTP